MRRTEDYVIKVKIGKGIATYQTDSRDVAMEIVRQKQAEGAEFTANFDWHTTECQITENE